MQVKLNITYLYPSLNTFLNIIGFRIIYINFIQLARRTEYKRKDNLQDAAVN